MNRYAKTIVLLGCVVASTNVIRAQDNFQPETGERHRLAGFRHYVATHKSVLVSDLLVTLAHGADTASTIHAMPYGGSEVNPFLPANPSHVQVYIFAAGSNVAAIAFIHLSAHGLRDYKFWRRTDLFFTGALVAEGVVDTIHNVRGAEHAAGQQSSLRLHPMPIKLYRPTLGIN